MMNDKRSSQLLLEEYRALREELLRCNGNAQGILNWSYPVLVSLFLAGLYGHFNLNQPVVVLAYYVLLIPAFITSLATVWLGEIVRQQRVEKYLFELEDRINGESEDDGYYNDRLYWHHWLRKIPKHPLEGFQYSHYRNIAVGYLLFVLFSELISITIVFQMHQHIIIKLLILLAPILSIISVVWWFNNQANKYFGKGVLLTEKTDRYK